MSKNRSAAVITNIIRQDSSGNIVFTSGSTTLATISTTGQLSGSTAVKSATTASYADNFTVAGTLTAQTLVVQTITSSVDYVTGSTRFGSLSSNTHTFTGSMSVSGSGAFVGIVGVGGATEAGWSLKSNGNLKVENSNGTTVLQVNDTSTGGKTWSLISAGAGNAHSVAAGSFYLRNSSDSSTAFTISSTGAATFSSSTINIGTSTSRGNVTIEQTTTNAGLVINSAIAESPKLYLRDGGGAGYSELQANNNLYLNASKVGIGTTSNIESLLTIKASQADGNQLYLIQSNDIRGWKLKAKTDGYFYLQSSYNTSDSTKLIVRYDNGFIGNGPDAPLYNFDLTGNDNTATSTYLRVYSNNRTVWTGIGYQRIETNGDLSVVSGGNTVFNTAGSERMRITSGGTLCVGRTTSPSSAYTAAFQEAVAMYIGTNGSNMINWFNASGTYICSIVINASSVNYNTSSDYRLKQDLKDFNGLSIVKSIKTYDFEWKSDNTRTHGVLAHELQEILPYAVSGEKDAIDENGNIKNQGVDYSKLVPILIKAIQELKAQNDDLQSQINELKAQ